MLRCTICFEHFSKTRLIFQRYKLTSHSARRKPIMPANRIAKLLEDIRRLDSGRFELVQALRKMILGLDSLISEEVKYGGFLFSAEMPFCGIFAYAKHVSLEFGAGAALADKFKVLQGVGKFRRHIKLSSVQDISEKHVHEYLILALTESAKQVPANTKRPSAA